jgi:uncharacterized membrane protein YhiD involved in acid resistance
MWKILGFGAAGLFAVATWVALTQSDKIEVKQDKVIAEQKIDKHDFNEDFAQMNAEIAKDKKSKEYWIKKRDNATKQKQAIIKQQEEAKKLEQKVLERSTKIRDDWEKGINDPEFVKQELDSIGEDDFKM